MIGKGVSIALILLVMCSPYLLLATTNIQKTTRGYTIETRLSLMIAEYDSPVLILSDTDFVEQGWPGNGSESSPFLISSLRFGYPVQVPIIIENTRVHFVVRNCTFEKQGMDFSYRGNVNAIDIFNVTNGIVEDCSISATNLAIGVTNCSEMTISNNTVRDTEHGFSFGELEKSTIHDNSIISGYVGIHANRLSRCNITRNTIAEVDWGITIGEFSENNTLSQNRIGWCVQEYASDYGAGNIWKDNSWSNWDGVGPYIISGSAGSLDESPSLFDADVLGPIIEFDNPLGYIESPNLFIININVTDSSGVDEVIIFIRETWWIDDEPVRSNWSEFVMLHQPSEGNPNNYAIVYQTNDSWSISCMVLAFDTLGQSRMSGMHSYGIRPYPPVPPPEPPSPSFSLLGLVVAFVVIIVLVARRTRSNSIP